MSQVQATEFSNTYFFLHDVLFPANYPAHKKPKHSFIPSESQLSALMEKKEDTRNLKHYVEFAFSHPQREHDNVVFKFAYDPKTSKVYIPDDYFGATIMVNLKSSHEDAERALVILHTFLRDCVRTVHINYKPSAPIESIKLNLVVNKSGASFDSVQNNADQNNGKEKEDVKKEGVDHLFGWDK